MVEQREIERMWHDGTLLGKRVRHRNQVRTVAWLCKDKPGHVILDRDLDAFMLWNIDELELEKD